MPTNTKKKNALYGCRLFVKMSDRVLFGCLLGAVLALAGCTFSTIDADGRRHIYSVIGKVTVDPPFAASSDASNGAGSSVGETVEVSGVGILINVGGGQPGITLGYGRTRSTLLYPNASIIVDTHGVPYYLDNIGAFRSTLQKEE